MDRTVCTKAYFHSTLRYTYDSYFIDGRKAGYILNRSKTEAPWFATVCINCVKFVKHFCNSAVWPCQMFDFSVRAPSPVGKVKKFLLCFKCQELEPGVSVYQWYYSRYWLRWNFKQIHHAVIWIPSCKGSQCYCQAFRHTDSVSKVCNFLVNCWTNEAYRTRNLQLTFFKKKKLLILDRSSPLSATPSFRKSNSSLSPSRIFRLPNVGRSGIAQSV
jgi:hypothetical protein